MTAPPLSPEMLAKSRSASITQRQREALLVKQSISDRSTDRRVSDAQQAVANGNTAAARDAIVQPSPELLASGEFERFEAELDNHQDRRANTVRRVLMAQVVRLYRRGVLDEEQFKACRWYRDRYEMAGFYGKVAIRNYAKEVFSAPGSYSAMTESQQEAASELRVVRAGMSKHLLKFFEAVVIEDIPITRARRFGRLRNGTETAKFREMTQQIVDGRQEIAKCA